MLFSWAETESFASRHSNFRSVYGFTHIVSLFARLLSSLISLQMSWRVNAHGPCSRKGAAPNPVLSSLPFFHFRRPFSFSAPQKCQLLSAICLSTKSPWSVSNFSSLLALFLSALTVSQFSGSEKVSLWSETPPNLLLWTKSVCQHRSHL